MENKHDVYRVEDCMKKFCQPLTEHVIKTTNFEKDNMIPIIKEQHESYEKAKICYVYKKVRR